jgi:hypothetical protein
MTSMNKSFSSITQGLSPRARDPIHQEFHPMKVTRTILRLELALNHQLVSLVFNEQARELNQLTESRMGVALLLAEEVHVGMTSN